MTGKELEVARAELEANLAMLRRQNVAEFVDVAGGGFTVKFFAPQPEAKEEKSQGPKKCACGHLEDDEHHNGFCIANPPCDPSKCSPE